MEIDAPMTSRDGTSPATAPLSPRRRAFNPTHLRENLTGWALVAPAALLIFIFGLFPVAYAAYMSLYNWRIRQGASLCETNAPTDLTGLDYVIGYIRGCLALYEGDILGDWGGAGLFVAGFLVIVLSYLLWTRTGKLAERVSAALLGSRPAADTVAGLVRVGLALVVMAVGFVLLIVGYQTMLTGLPPRDRDFLVGLQITLYYAIGSIPAQIGLGLLLAYALFRMVRGRELFRMVFFLPYITPAVASALVFGIIFSGRDTSLANQFISWAGFDLQRWLSEPRPFLNALFGLELEGFWAGPSMSLVVVILMGIWTYTGYNAIIFMAGLGSIPGDLYEAAKVDGASEWQLFRHITIPLLSPTTFYLSIIGFINTFTAFNTLYIMRTSASQGTLDTAALVIFDTFRIENRLGEAAAQAIILMLIVLALTQVQRSLFEKRVFYG